MGLSVRVKQLRESKGWTQLELASHIGVNMERIRNMENDRVKKLTGEEATKFTSIFDIDPMWLMTGQGVKESSNDQIYTANDNDLGIWYYSTVSAAAGYGVEVLEEAKEQYNFAKHALKSMISHAGNLSVISVQGDSMEPQFRNGDQLFVDTSQNTLSREGVYVLRVRDALLVKMVQMEPAGVRLISHNPRYRDIELKGDEYSHSEDVVVVGKVIGSVGFLY